MKAGRFGLSSRTLGTALDPFSEHGVAVDNAESVCSLSLSVWGRSIATIAGGLGARCLIGLFIAAGVFGFDAQRSRPTTAKDVPARRQSPCCMGPMGRRSIAPAVTWLHASRRHSGKLQTTRPLNWSRSAIFLTPNRPSPLAATASIWLYLIPMESKC